MFKKMAMDNVNQVTQTLKSFFSDQDRFIGLHEPTFNGNEWSYVKECLDTGWVSSVGKFVDRFEESLSHFTGIKFAIATVNGTAALHIAFLLAGVEADDEVLVPTLTFVATTNAINYCRAIPHFVDTTDKLGIDAAMLANYLKNIAVIKNGQCFNRETNRRIRALCVMHTLGHPVDMDPLVEIANIYHLKIIEDAAESLGAYYKGKHVGYHGLLTTLSFNGNKIITTGGGGAILTNDEALAKHAKHLTTTAKKSHPWLFEHDEVGYNYRMPNINAALGCAQLEKIDGYLKAKRALFKAYQLAFQDFANISFVEEPANTQSNYWLIALRLKQIDIETRNHLLTELNNCGIMSRPLWNLQHTLPMYQHCPRMPLETAARMVREVITLPSSPHLYAKLNQSIKPTAIGLL